MSIKRGDLVQSQGSNVKVFSEAKGSSSVLRTYPSSGVTIGTSTGKTVKATDETIWLEVLIADPLSAYGVRTAFVDEEFVTSKANPDYDYTKDNETKPSSTSTTDEAATTGLGGGAGGRDTVSVYETQKSGTIPVKTDGGKIIYVKVSADPVADKEVDTADAAQLAKFKKWATYGFIGVLVIVVVGVIIVLTRKPS